MSTTYQFESSRTDGIQLLPAYAHSRIVETYMAVWMFLMPLVSFLVIPGIQGTIPAYLMAFASPIFCLNRKYFSTLLILFAVWFSFLLISQTGLIMSGTQAFFELHLVEPTDPTPAFRKTLITQSLYLAACVLIFMFMRLHYQPHMLRYVFYGAWFLVIYGLYDWSFTTATGMSGDFLSNRVYEQSSGDSRDASWSQYYRLGPISLLRLKSMTEEPSRFATLAVAYLSLALTSGRRWLALALLVTLFLSTSLTGALALVVMFGILIWRSGRDIKKWVIAAFGLALIFGVVAAFTLPEVVDEMIMTRVRGEHTSAQTRTSRLTETIPVFMQLPIINQLFGVGFGTAFLPGSLSMLVNCGLVGLVGAAWFFLRPIVRLSKIPGELGLFAALSTLLAVYTVISAALFVPVVWMLLGMGYARVAEASEDHGLAFNNGAK